MWSILDSGKKITMPLSLPELMALYFGRDLLNVLKNTVFHDSLKSLFSKIKTNGTFYIIGHCMMRKTMRTFACDRIKTIDITDEAFIIPASFNID